MNHSGQHRNGIPLACNGALTLALLLVTMAAMTGAAHTQSTTESVLYSFKGGADGGSPNGSLVLDAQGNVYGTTSYGGNLAACTSYAGSGCGTVFAVDAAGNETVLYTFPGGAGGNNPSAGLVRDSQGNLYGTVLTPQAATLAAIVFKIAPPTEPGGSWSESAPWAFGLPACSSFSYPAWLANITSLVQDSQGNLYGSTGSSLCTDGFYEFWVNAGTVYKVDAAGGGSTLYTFPADGDRQNYYFPYGADPSSLVRDSQGNLYGATAYGGGTGADTGANVGTIFEVGPSGNITTLYTFTSISGGGSSLVRDAQGNLYGTSFRGGANDFGSVFKLDTAGNYTVLYSFKGGTDGAYPKSGLVLDAQGNLYGTTSQGGNLSANCPAASAWSCGTVFKVDAAGNETVLYAFKGTGGDAANPTTGLVLDAQGNLYGATAAGGANGNGAVFKVTPGTQTAPPPPPSPYVESMLYSFKGSPDGASPNFGLALDAQGTIFGATAGGGATGNGTVFEVGSDGHETVIYSFCLHPLVGDFCPDDGISPAAGVVRDGQGNLYGVTDSGGTNEIGTVFKVDPAGEETVLSNFTNATGGPCCDSPLPASDLILDAQGNLYGANAIGGSSGAGVVFKVDPSGNVTVLYNFTGKADGENPSGNLALDTQGNLYGAAYSVVFKLDPTGSETVLYTFTADQNGSVPNGSFVLDSQGNLYGTTYLGGDSACYPPYGGCGTVFKVDPTGTETVLHAFTGPDGADPLAGVIRDAQGNLYGTTSIGGEYGRGTVFMLDTSGKETVLYSFKGGQDGESPVALLVRDAQGNLYGTTPSGGAFGYGTVFKLSPRSVTGTRTTTTLASSLNPSEVGQAVAFTASVASGTGAPPDGETVTFMKGSAALGTAALSGGSAGFTTSTLPAGTSMISAVYGGDSNLSGSKSNPVKQVVERYATSTALVSSLNPSVYGQSLTWTATVTSSGLVAPTGNVQFTWGGYSLGEGVLNANGVATLTRSNLNADGYPLVAVYSGDANNAGSASAILNQVVQETTSAATLTSSANPSSAGELVTFTAKITSPTNRPTGPVTFMAGKTVLGTAQLKGGAAKFAISTLPAGTTAVTATYYGDSNIASSSASVTQTVK
jgi:uncharacterized repeat protein (TIGR03803 family)